MTEDSTQSIPAKIADLAGTAGAAAGLVPVGGAPVQLIASGLETAARAADWDVKGAAVAAVQGVAISAADLIPVVGTIANGSKLLKAGKTAAKLL